MTEALESDLALIRDAARQAGQLAVQMRAAGLTTENKPDNTPVSNADLALDGLLKSMLTAARPDYGWLSEETADDSDRLKRQRLFVVDPIDGTSAFVKDKPWWGVSIAVVDGDRPSVGVFHVPDVEETYYAVAGQGAWRNGAPIHPSTTADLENCAMLADAPMFRHPAWPRPWPPMNTASRNSVAYRLCLVAAGDFDAVLAMSSKAEWDLAAADLIATEAGCLVTNHKGARFRYNQVSPKARSLVCAGPALHPLILERVQPINLRD
ncbi:MAG TPA: 3'(2'),5'-bisphosphate nucleotidase CysQ [Caulobacteraceae bacterium]|jgi:myo-inositol-1(or 4)-monophosphatase|nr:3'(2'),5'-bisphosphate nucleotidase CysQ [Caulobacteraceae bacterium]